MTENDSESAERRETESSPDHQLVGHDPPGPESSQPKKGVGFLRFATLGTELAAFTLTFTAIGYFLDTIRHHDHRYATAIGTLIGFTLGLVRFIVMVRKDQN